VRRQPPPLRFLAVVLGGWVLARGVMLAPLWSETAGALPPQLVGEPKREQVALLPVKVRARAWMGQLQRPSTSLATSGWVGAAPPLSQRPFSDHQAEVASVYAYNSALKPDLPSLNAPAPAGRLLLSAILPTQAAATLPVSLPALPPEKRLAVSAWAFVREGEAAQLAAGGLLGGSQLGARLTYRLNGNPARPLALSMRAYMPLRDSDGAEIAGGVEWQPFARLPVRLLAERRQAIGRNGRSAFALLAHGGISEARIAGPIELDAYAQAGVVGARSRDLFADGSIRASLPLTDGLKVGAGVWGAAQPGISRLDAGPQISWRLPVERAAIRVAADWRLRVAGDAAPRSGPSLTLSTDF